MAHVGLVPALLGWLDARLVGACPVQQSVAEQLAVPEHPFVRAQVVDDVAVVEDRLSPRRELQARRECAGLLRGAEAVAGKAVGPLVGAAERLRPEPLDEPGREQAGHATAHGAQPAAFPPQLGDLAGREEPVPGERDDNLEVARLERARGLGFALTPAQQLALGQAQLGVGVERGGHATSKRVGWRSRKRSSSRALRMRSAALMRSAGSNSSKTCA